MPEPLSITCTRSKSEWGASVARGNSHTRAATSSSMADYSLKSRRVKKLGLMETCRTKRLEYIRVKSARFDNPLGQEAHVGACRCELRCAEEIVATF
jgi:hypothetical protein